MAALQKSLLCVYMCQQTQGWIAAGLNLEDCMGRNDQKVCNSCFIWGIHWLQGKSIRREEISSFWEASNTFTTEISFQRHYYSTGMERTETWEGHSLRHWGLRKLFKLRPRKGWCGRERTSDDGAEEEVWVTVQGTTVAKLQSLSFILKVIGSFLKVDKGRARSSFYSCGHLDYLCSGELQVRQSLAPVKALPAGGGSDFPNFAFSTSGYSETWLMNICTQRIAMKEETCPFW